MRPWARAALSAGILVLAIGFLGEVVPPRPGQALVLRWLSTMDAHPLRSWVAWSLLLRAVLPDPSGRTPRAARRAANSAGTPCAEAEFEID